MSKKIYKTKLGKILAIAQVAFDYGDFRRAEILYKLAVKINPVDPKINYNLALCYESIGKEYFTIFYLEKAIHYDSSFAEGFSKLGEIYVKQGYYADGIKMLRTAVRLEPSYDVARAKLALAYQANKQIIAALKHQSVLVNKYPKDERILIAYTTMLLLKGSYTILRKVLEQGIIDVPNSTELHRRYVQLNSGEDYFELLHAWCK